jgi:hypothetical protein
MTFIHNPQVFVYLLPYGSFRVGIFRSAPSSGWRSGCNLIADPDDIAGLRAHHRRFPAGAESVVQI